MIWNARYVQLQPRHGIISGTYITECLVMFLVLGMFRVEVELEAFVRENRLLLIELVQESI